MAKASDEYSKLESELQSCYHYMLHVTSGES